MNDWEERYQQGDTGWDRGSSSPALYTWLDSGALKPCRILIPGCGLGHEVVTLARLGYDVTAVDIAPSATKHLQQKLADAGVTATVICDDLFNYQSATPFDAIHEQTCLCAIQPEQRREYEACVRRWLKPGGELFALFMQTDSEGGPPFHCDLQQMRQLFNSDDWLWSNHEPIRVPRKSGRFEMGTILSRR